MPAPAPKPGDTPPAAVTGITADDLEKMKTGILDSVKSQQQEFMSSILEQIKTKPKEEPMPDPKVVTLPDDFNEYKDELENLGVDESGAKALISMFSKIVAKQTSNLKADVVSTVDKNVDWKDKKKTADMDAAAKYPAVLDKNSAIWKESAKVYEAFSDEFKKAPDATAMAVKMAAANLGIAPLDINTIRAQDSVTPNGAGGGGNPPKKEVTEKEKGFADLFHVNQDSFAKHLKAIREKALQ